MWLSFTSKGRAYATCDHCNADFSLKEARTFDCCPRCGTKHDGVEGDIVLVDPEGEYSTKIKPMEPPFLSLSEGQERMEGIFQKEPV